MDGLALLGIKLLVLTLCSVPIVSKLCLFDELIFLQKPLFILQINSIFGATLQKSPLFQKN